MTGDRAKELSLIHPDDEVVLYRVLGENRTCVGLYRAGEFRKAPPRTDWASM